jgi:G:T-mismatch repair DNA endonuclease (very short patch repair protein)
MRTPAVAVKLGQSSEALQGFQVMGTITCDGCGERFWIQHHCAFADSAVAARQAVWLEKVLANDHERERKHQDKIELP